MNRRILSFIMALVLLAGLMPAEHVHAEDEHRCPDCDTYWGDNSVDHCQYCGRCEDCCDICYACGEICTDCHQEDFMIGEGEYFPCPDCGYCKADGREYCLECGRCADCVDLCEACGDYCPDCHADIASGAEDLPCPDCGMCKADGRSFCEECGICEDCAYICGSCSLCDECAHDMGVHCPECGECCEEYGYCEDGGDHCAECCEANGWLCENCGLCCEALGLDMCPVCGMCEDCCAELREDLGCTCDDKCWTEVEDEHLCVDCGRCFGQVEYCEYCADYAGEWRCVECCRDLSRIEGCDCSTPICVNDPDWDDHFAENHADFSGGHAPKASSAWSMDENEHWHACRYCDEAEHVTGRASHSFDTRGICTVCGFNRDADLFILIQPKDQNVKQIYSGWCEDSDEPADDVRETAVSFSVKVYSKNGAENLNYQWYKNNDYTPLHDTDYDDQYSVGTRTSKFTTKISARNCKGSIYGGPYFCIITDNVSGESVTTDWVYIRAEHNYRLVTEDGTDPAGHRLLCCGLDCGALGPVEPHTYGGWAWHYNGGAQEYKYHTCTVCNYEERVYVHEHNYDFGLIIQAAYDGDSEIIEENDRINQYVYGFTHNGKAMQGGSNRAYHWIDCSEPGCTFSLKEEHQWGDWEFVTLVSPTKPGGAYQVCKSCGMQKTWSKTYYEWHTHPVNVTGGSSDTDFAAENSSVTVFVTPQGKGKKVTGGTASIDYLYTTNTGRTSTVTTTLNLTAVAEGQTYRFTVPQSRIVSRGTIEYKANPIYVEFTYEDCDHAVSEQRGVVAATCTKDGYTGDLVCIYCGNVLEKGEYIAPTGHGEPVLAEENVYAMDFRGNIIYNKRGGYNVPVYLVHAPEDVYCDDMTARGCYSGDMLCPDCGEVIEYGRYTAKLHYYELLNDIDEPARSELIDSGLKLAVDPQPGVPGYTGDQVCYACEAVKYGKMIPALPEVIVVLGDVNLDKDVNAKDLTALARHVAKIQLITDRNALLNADVNGDGAIDAKDLTKLARYVAKIIPSL